MFDTQNLLQQLSIWTIPVLFAITVHEVAHGFVARAFGDRTAEMLGRLTLNPIRHIDPVGTVLVPLIMLLLPGGFVFGWAKPVPVAQRNLRNPRRDMMLVAAAGPVSNLLMAVFWALMAKLAMLVEMGVVSGWLYNVGIAGIIINLVLAILNLLPIPPLDGGRVVSNALPPQLSDRYDRLEPFGLLIIVALLASGVLSRIISPIFYGAAGIIAGLFGLNF